MDKQKTLITGGAGFIGSHLAEALAPQYDVVLFDNLRRNSLRYFGDDTLPDGVTFVEGDVLDAAMLRQAMEDADIVLHLAAIAGVSSYYSESSMTLRVNILGTLNVLESMLATGTKQLIDFSTSEVYGAQARNVSELSAHCIGPVHEKRWVYAVSKLASEHLALRYGEEHGLRCSCIRPFNVYGPRQTGEGAISNFCESLIAGRPLTIYGDGQDRRAWCFVSDLVDGTLRVVQTPDAAGKAFNIGNPSQVVTTTDLAELLIEVHGSGTIQFRESTHAPIQFRSPDITRAQAILKYEPAVELEEGLSRTLAWYKETCV